MPSPPNDPALGRCALLALLLVAPHVHAEAESCDPEAQSCDLEDPQPPPGRPTALLQAQRSYGAKSPSVADFARKLNKSEPRSCRSYGCVGYTPANACQCNDLCAKYGNCCPDYVQQCTASCAKYGCVGYTPSNDCQCNDLCSKYGNCCGDYDAKCGAPSCARYGCVGYTPGNDCQCNDLCSKYGNCCNDYQRCTDGDPTPAPSPPAGQCATIGCVDFDPSLSCQCNSQCAKYGNCCRDYEAQCAGPPPPGPSADEYWKGVNVSDWSALHQKLSSTHKHVSYGGLWDAYKHVWVDLPGQCAGKIFEVYSDKCWTPGTEQCGSAGYAKEGDCYNREHSWPKSWWDRVINDAYSDMFHVYPSDGFVNGKRSNYPWGEVANPTYTSSDGSKLGPCSTPGFSGTCFEPSGKHKGNLARGHFYVSVRYDGELACCDKDGVHKSEIKPWLKALLLKWHDADPVEPWEEEFNNRVVAYQGNRNPFIDFPDLAHVFFP